MLRISDKNLLITRDSGFNNFKLDKMGCLPGLRGNMTALSGTGRIR